MHTNFKEGSRDAAEFIDPAILIQSAGEKKIQSLKSDNRAGVQQTMLEEWCFSTWGTSSRRMLARP